MSPNLHISERGAALITTLGVVVALFGASSTYVLLSYGSAQASRTEMTDVRARVVAEEGLHLSMAELKSGVDTDLDGLGTITFIGPDGRAAAVTATDLGGEVYRLYSVGGTDGVEAGLRALVQVVPAEPLSFPFRAAITAEGDVVTSGNIEVDGRDWSPDLLTLRGPGVFGISSMQDINQSGSSTIGGNGSAPSRPADPVSIDAWTSWNDGLDNDGDGTVDEEAYDGLDNDGDGLVDEDTDGYPQNPDVIFGLPLGTLEAAARSRGTYFETEEDLNSYLSRFGGNVPGGAIIYATFDTWRPADFGSVANDPPSIIIHHNGSGTALMKNIHGSFRGAVLADFVEHINGDFQMAGAFMSFSDESVGNAFGNGSAQVFFSSEVLGSLPSTSAESRIRVLNWQRASAFE